MPDAATQPPLATPRGPSPGWARLLPLPPGLDTAFEAWLERHVAETVAPRDDAGLMLAARLAQAHARLHWSARRLADGPTDAPPDARWLRVEAQAARQLAAIERAIAEYRRGAPTPPAGPPAPTPPAPQSGPEAPASAETPAPARPGAVTPPPASEHPSVRAELPARPTAQAARSPRPEPTPAPTPARSDAPEPRRPARPDPAKMLRKARRAGRPMDPREALAMVRAVLGRDRPESKRALAAAGPAP